MGKTLKEILEERSAIYADYSNQIMNKLESNVIPAVLDLLELTSNEMEKLEWKTVQETDGHLVMGGVIKYQEGDVVTDNDTTVVLDSAMAALLDKIVRVAIPLDLAETGTREEIYQHLLESQERLRDEYEAVYGHEPESLEEAMEQAVRSQIGMDFGPDFDYNDLTEEQKEALFISMSGPEPGDKLN